MPGNVCCICVTQNMEHAVSVTLKIHRSNSIPLSRPLARHKRKQLPASPYPKSRNERIGEIGTSTEKKIAHRCKPSRKKWVWKSPRKARRMFCFPKHFSIRFRCLRWLEKPEILLLFLFSLSLALALVGCKYTDATPMLSYGLRSCRACAFEHTHTRNEHERGTQ